MSKKNCTKDNTDIIVYTDGSCMGNGKPNAVGGIGIHFPNNELKDISKVFDLGCCTNQRTELYAILTAFRYIKQYIGMEGRKIIVMTDSQYSIDCITKWVNSWIKNGWKTKTGGSVANKEFIEILHKYYEKYNIEFYHVDAHTGLDDKESVANAKADSLATMATKKAIKEKQFVEDVKNFKNNFTKSSSKNSNKSKSKSNYSNYSNKVYQSDCGSDYEEPKNKMYKSSLHIPKNGNFVVELVKTK